MSADDVTAVQPEWPAVADPDVGEYLRVVWRRRRFIVVGTLIAALCALGVCRLLPREYRATAVLRVTEPGGANTQALGVPVTTFTRMLSAPTLARSIIQRYSLEKPPWRLDTAGFLNRLELEQVRGTNLIRVSFTLEDAAWASALLNVLTEEVVAENHRLNEAATESGRNAIYAQLESAKEQVRKADALLLESRRKMFGTDATLGLQGALSSVFVAMDREDARLELAREELLDLDKRLRSRSPRDGYLLTVYDGLERQIAASRLQLAALEQRRQTLIDGLHLDETQRVELSRAYAAQARLTRVELERRELELGIARAAADNVGYGFEQSRYFTARRMTELQLVERAVPPGSVASPRTVPAVSLTAAIACFILVLGSLVEYKVRASLRRGRAY